MSAWDAKQWEKYARQTQNSLTSLIYQAWCDGEALDLKYYGTRVGRLKRECPDAPHQRALLKNVTDYYLTLAMLGDEPDEPYLPADDFARVSLDAMRAYGEEEQFLRFLMEEA